MKIAYFLILFLQLRGILTQQNDDQAALDQFCFKNGGSNAVAKLHSGVIQFQGCIDSTVSEWTAEIQRTSKPEAGFELVCSEIHNLKDCTKRMANSLKDCFRSDQQEIIDLGYKTTSAGLDFLCDNIDDIQKAMSSDDLSCVTTKEHAFKQCERYNSSHNHNQHHEADPFAALEALKVSYDAKDCSDLLGLERCTIKVLAECRDQLFARLLENMWKYANSAIPCDNLPKSKASTTGVVSVLLLISAAFNMYL